MQISNFLQKGEIMRKLLLGIVISMVCSAAFADQECDDTWNNSSAAGSCGYVCSNPNGSNIKYGSTYDPVSNQCNFYAGCCNGTTLCSYNGLASCTPNSNFIVTKGDSNFYNSSGKLTHGASSKSSSLKTTRHVQ